MKKFFSFLAAFAFAAGLLAQQPQPLPIDPNVRLGHLDNGLTYYIRHNEQPKERCEFHIAQGVGAILEEDHQNGLAHFLEHMAFNGTTHFPGKLLINYFQSVGLSFGGDINAYTSLDETVYRLSNVPTREEVLDSALLVMHDWSSEISLLGEEIDSERGVIREEWRQGNTANRRLWSVGNKYKYPGSQYAKRDVIGDTAVINNFSYQAIRDYYELWYGPDLQCIVIVGDIDVDKMEQKLIKVFSDVAPRANRGVRPRYGIPDNVEPIVAVYTEKEAQFTQLGIEYKHKQLPREDRLSDQGYTLLVINNLIQQMISYRFEEMAMDPKANFIQAFGDYGPLLGTTDAFQLVFVPKDGHEKAAMNDMFLQAEKIKRYGFTNSELERAKTDYQAMIEEYYNERNNCENVDYAEEYYRHYLDAEPAPGIEWEYEATKAILPNLPVAVVNQLAQAYITENNVVISYLGKESNGKVEVPSQEEILNMYNASKTAEIEAPVEESFDKPLIEKAPKAGKIKKEKFNKDLGTTELTLSNGIRVVIKPTNFKSDEINMYMTSEGGLSKVDVKDLPSAMLAGMIVAQNGIGEFSALDLQKVLTGKNAGVSTDISEYSEAVQGYSTVKDFETLMQLTYLHFTAPRKDDDAFQTLMAMLNTSLAAREKDPQTAFNDSIKVTETNHHERTVFVDSDLLKKVDQDRAIEIYKERFANPADFLVTFIGNIDPEDAKTRDLICTWLGGLKTSKKLEKFSDNGIRMPKGKVFNHFEKEMQTKQASNYIAYSGEMENTLENRVNMGLISDLLDSRYLETIREKEGGSYGVGTYGYITRKPIEQAVMLMQFDTDPEKQEKLMAIIHEEVRNMIENGPIASDLQKHKKARLNQLATDLESNDFWTTIIVRYYLNGENYLTDYKSAVENINAESIVRTLKSLVEQGNVLEVVMSPAAE